MYEYIKGKFISINKDYVVLENNGIGYKIFTSGNTMAQMPNTNEEVKLNIIQIVRDDFIGLYGFLTKEEVEMFNLLLTINGVGAKATLSLLSICTVANLKYAILSSDEKTITKAPGIGKKIAQRIILELKDKLDLQEVMENGIDETIIEMDVIHNEAFGALLALGYSEKEAEKAVKAVGKEANVEDMIKKCLRYLMK
ncbi:Holliday junction branch migration protein RuvA [Clostridium senegalense]|uniref:Holliday junction branch migration complex subunit RuvA n=1 Tax=Clostridium senegalense TaxID=1465809 RepID=A0A6M0GZY8_9CLOT|nr:Holliday junction branch migration protein RuvA [Clostridium senegalense]NEU03889.1 Holliday junction branch migration protein RuvA [Clostridium senegalense]